MPSKPPTPDEQARANGFKDADEERHHAAALLDDDYTQSFRDGVAPSPVEMWATIQGLSEPEGPLTIQEAAARENVHDKTIRRKLDALAAMDPPGAYREGRVWRIVPAALDALKTAPASRKSRGSRGPLPKGKPSPSTSTRWE